MKEIFFIDKKPCSDIANVLPFFLKKKSKKKTQKNLHNKKIHFTFAKKLTRLLNKYIKHGY
jgi:hypothetical protein